ncbi:MAG TPA: helix-turn-helix domain-containing protein [Longimicrobium sp.]|jgi:putative transcriptional regulator
MRDDLFEELMESVRQAGAIMRGEMKPSRVFDPDDIDVAALRERFGLSQPRFAAMLGISVGTLRNWEQGRRRPDGPAQVLLRVADRNPEVVLEAAAAANPKSGPDAS